MHTVSGMKHTVTCTVQVVMEQTVSRMSQTVTHTVSVVMEQAVPCTVVVLVVMMRLTVTCTVLGEKKQEKYKVVKQF